MWQSIQRKIGWARDGIVRTPPNPRILLVSSGGVRNHGDDAILLATLQRLGRVRPGCQITVVSDGDALPPLIGLCAWAGTTENVCRGLEPAAIRRGCGSDGNLADQLIMRVAAGTSRIQPGVDLSHFDTVLLAGGGNLTMHFPGIVAWRTAIAAACRSRKVPFVLSGQGVGPISEEITAMLKFLVAHAHRFGTRDPLSASLVAVLPRDGARIDCVGDDALGLITAPENVVDNYLEAAGVPLNTPLLAFHAREAPGYGAFDRNTLVDLAQWVDRVAASQGHAVVALPINSQTWAPECELLEQLAQAETRHAPWFVVDCGSNAAAIAGVIGRCRAVITLSYHVALFALERGVPTRMAVRTEYYHRKADGLRRFFGLTNDIVLPAPPGDLRFGDLAVERNSNGRLSSVGVAIDSWLDQALPPSKPIRERYAA